MIRSLRFHRKAALFDPSTPVWSLHLIHYVRNKSPRAADAVLAEDGQKRKYVTQLSFTKRSDADGDARATVGHWRPLA